MQVTLLSVRRDKQAAHYTSLTPEGIEPVEIRATITVHDDAPGRVYGQRLLTVYYYGFKKSGAKNIRRTSRTWTLGEESIHFFPSDVQDYARSLVRKLKAGSR